MARVPDDWVSTAREVADVLCVKYILPDLPQDVDTETDRKESPMVLTSSGEIQVKSHKTAIKTPPGQK